MRVTGFLGSFRNYQLFALIVGHSDYHFIYLMPRTARLGVAVMHRRGVIAAGTVTLTAKGKVRGLRTGSVPAAGCPRRPHVRHDVHGVTVAVAVADGRVAALRGDWC